MSSKTSHWNDVYERRAPDDVSWYQQEASRSLALIGRSGIALDAPIVDVGAGASRLVDGLLARGHADITLVDVAQSAFGPTRERLVDLVGAAKLEYVVADITQWKPPRTFALWHDRAVFHFLTDERDRHAYRDTLISAVAPGDAAVIATFALDGPERCSGLPVRRYSAETLAAEFEGALTLIEAEYEVHQTPAGGMQSFVFARFQRR